MNDNLSQYLTQIEAAKLLRIAPRSLERMRHQGTGPSFMKCGRRVLYTLETIDDWLQSRSFSSTAAAKRAGVG